MTEKVYSEDQKILCLNLKSNEVYTIIDHQAHAYAKLSDDRCSNRTLNENGEVNAIELSQEKFNSMKAVQQKFTNLKSAIMGEIKGVFSQTLDIKVGVVSKQSQFLINS